jgi:hypothetical protein
VPKNPSWRSRLQPNAHAGQHSAASACLEEEHQLWRARRQPELVQRLLVAVAAIHKREAARLRQPGSPAPWTRRCSGRASSGLNAL